METLGRYEAVGRKLGEHCDRANKKYSDPSVNNTDALRWSTQCLESLWPRGVPANKVWIAGWIGRVLDKIYRMAVCSDIAGTEDAFADNAGYAIRIYELWDTEKRGETAMYNAAKKARGETLEAAEAQALAASQSYLVKEGVDISKYYRGLPPNRR